MDSGQCTADKVDNNRGSKCERVCVGYCWFARTDAVNRAAKWLIRGRRIDVWWSNRRHGHLYLPLCSPGHKEKDAEEIGMMLLLLHRKAARAVFSVAWSRWELAQWPLLWREREEEEA